METCWASTLASGARLLQRDLDSHQHVEALAHGRDADDARGRLAASLLLCSAGLMGPFQGYSKKAPTGFEA